ncbi:MAG: MFS transporter [Candidatus Tectomicrobia bacterium]|uniref:MFS transporter n=1 Tax=Tectimicrobiota bacterium TaxID=2528274 RepID=A0A933LQZ5_UNCTE|nr:MFS transporter [Candidatus Tectomicrobia bacterium]
MAWKYYHTVWVIMAGGWVSLYLARMGLAPLLGLIMEEFKLSHAMAGVLFSAIFYSYGLMQLPSGYLGDRFGRRKILILATSLWFLFSLSTAAAHTLTMLLVVRVLTGLAHGLYFGNERPTVFAFTPKDKMGQGQGISFMGLCAGLFLSVFFSGLIAEYFRNWRLVFLIFSIPSLVTSILIFKFIMEPPKSSQAEKPLTARVAYRKAIADGNLWLMYLLGFVLLFAYWVIIAWLPSIYEEIGIATITGRSLLTGILGLIGLPAMFISGLMSDKLVRKGFGRKWLIALMVFLWALLMLWIGFALKNGASIGLVSSLFFSAAFVVFGVWPPYYALLSEMSPGEVMGTVFGLANFIGFLSTWIAPFLTGWIKDQTGSFAGGLFVSSAMLIMGTILTLALRSPHYENKS